MKPKGVSLEMRLVSTKDAYEKVSHDRFIIGQNIKYNVPSYTTLAKGRFSEIKKTNNYVPFIDYWNNKDSLDILKDWPRIRDTLDKTKRYTRLYVLLVAKQLILNLNQMDIVQHI